MTPVFAVHSGGDQGCAEDPAPATIVSQRVLIPTSTLQGRNFAVITDPAAFAPLLPGNLVHLKYRHLPSDRISIQTRRRIFAAAGTAPPATYYGFGSGRAPISPVRCAVTPLRAPRPGLRAPVVKAPAPAASSFSYGTHPVRPRPGRVRGNPFFRASAANFNTACVYDRLGRPRRSCQISLPGFSSALFARRQGSTVTRRARVQCRHALHSPRPAGSVFLPIVCHVPLPANALRRCPRSILSDNGPHFCFEYSHTVFQLLGVSKVPPSS